MVKGWLIDRWSEISRVDRVRKPERRSQSRLEVELKLASYGLLPVILQLLSSALKPKGTRESEIVESPLRRSP